jgi:methyl-accepting chemotaxis protein
MSLRTKILSLVSFACIFCTGAAVFVARQRMDASMQDGLVHKSEAILTRLESARRYVANQNLLNDTIDRIVKRYPDGRVPDSVKEDVLKVVPIYAALKIGMDDSKRDNYKFRVAATEPRRKENQADTEELEFMRRFEEDTNLKQIVFQDEKEDSIVVIRPVRISEADGCLNCHGNPSTSPWKNGTDVLGFKMENWKDGHLHGIFKISSALAPVRAEVRASSMNILYWAMGLLMAALAVSVYLLRKPIATLDQITQKLNEASQETTSSSEELGGAAASVSAATSEQAAAIQETMASMAEMNSMVAKTLDLAKQTQDLSSDLDQQTKNGTQVMNGMVSSMESIKQSNEELKKMVQIINDISIKTNVINDIVFKTQLLSVNASIEAARAGQHGKGFAVVAEEVGNLAQISGKAAEEIREMLNRSQSNVQEIVAVTNDRVSEGEKVSHEAMKSFVELSDGISKIQSYAQSVNEATTQQQEGIQQISAAMTQMDQASQQNSQMASTVSALSENMVGQSQDLKELCNDTQMLVYGNTTQSTSTDKAARPAPSTDRPKAPVAKGSMPTSVTTLAQKLQSRAKLKGPPSNGHRKTLDADSDDFGQAA